MQYTCNVGAYIMYMLLKSQAYPEHCVSYTVEPVFKDHPNGHKNVVCQDRWSLVTGSVVLKCRFFWRKCMVCQDRWSLMAVVSQDRFHCIYFQFKYSIVLTIVCYLIVPLSSYVIVTANWFSDKY